ncbi:MAG: M15 family metallopeptidase [Oscillospiraceae bacterium]|nr:M15 family metallopeptidase [Oscillospiraceae bacterium]
MAAYRSTGKELRKSPKGLIAGILALFLAAGAGYGAKLVLDDMVTLTPADSQEVTISVPDETESLAEESDEIDFGMESLSPDDVRQGPLILVNSDYPTEDATDGLATVFAKKSDIVTVMDMTVRLNEEAIEAINKMAADFQTATGHTDLFVLSGFVSKDEQKRRYEADLQRTGNETSTSFDLPGCNDFESGYTFELALFPNGKLTDFTAEGDYEWITEHCAEYGLIQRFPEDKSEQTGKAGNPTVFRYVGTPHAWYMKENNLCLEEYSALLESYPYDGEHLMITDQLSVPFEIYYFSVDPNDQEQEAVIPVPIGYKFNVSGDNKHGFIVTIELE